jgi:anti-sigma B factor antagonist
MDVSIYEYEGIVVLGIIGSITGMHESTPLTDQIKALLRKGKNRFVFDLHDVDWINSSGIGVIMRNLTAIRSNNGDLKLARPSLKVKNILEITHFDEIVGVYENVAKAVQNFNA